MDFSKSRKFMQEQIKKHPADRIVICRIAVLAREGTMSDSSVLSLLDRWRVRREPPDEVMAFLTANVVSMPSPKPRMHRVPPMLRAAR